MLKIGITGQAGFVGTHLYNTLGLFTDKFIRVQFKDDFFYDNRILEEFVSQCDVIVHLAAMNRHNDPKVIYETNLGLVNKLISACEATKSAPHILFSSSTQEERDNLYGKSKKEGRQLLENWALKNKAKFTGFCKSEGYASANAILKFFASLDESNTEKFCKYAATWIQTHQNH